MKRFFVYILASRSRALYVGVTSDLQERLFEHQAGISSDFTTRYKINRLVYFEEFMDARAAIAREKQIKSWRRSKKIRLIESKNPDWDVIPAI